MLLLECVPTFSLKLIYLLNKLEVIQIKSDTLGDNLMILNSTKSGMKKHANSDVQWKPLNVIKG